jgi:hypothetical protein
MAMTTRIPMNNKNNMRGEGSKAIDPGNYDKKCPPPGKFTSDNLRKVMNRLATRFLLLISFLEILG